MVKSIFPFLWTLKMVSYRNYIGFPWNFWIAVQAQYFGLKYWRMSWDVVRFDEEGEPGDFSTPSQIRLELIINMLMKNIREQWITVRARFHLSLISYTPHCHPPSPGGIYFVSPMCGPQLRWTIYTVITIHYLQHKI
jgi:hypothetical protein